ncbi:MAG: extracellular solute-binding protein [Planctomycetia bacterium]|nr:extracellular solute-binding protein [Planctomycetia bacterium]
MRSCARQRRWAGRTICVFGLLFCGCWTSSGPEVVVYTALDSEFSRPILRDFTERSGVKALAKFDTESTKTVGLTEELIAERARPRCDVFWNNEILHTLRLEELGLLDTYQPPLAVEYPAMDRSPRGTWHGFAARARVLVVNTRLVSQAERPRSINDLNDPKWKDRVGIAKPLFGTTATHAACLFATWGDGKAKQFFRQLKQNAQIMSGNKQVALSVAAGQLAFGLTDTDDAIGELEKGMDVAIIYPDQQPDGVGTLFIPNTLAILKGCPHPTEARRLVDYMLRPEIEEQLANSASAQIPLHPRAKGTTRVESPSTIRAMQVDFGVAAARWKEVAAFLRDEFTTGR